MKDKPYISVIFFTSIILVVTLSLFLIFEANDYNKLRVENQRLSSENSDLNINLDIQREMLADTLDYGFTRDCMIRNYSFYDNSKGSFCCKWVNNIRICEDWFIVVTNTPITVDAHNFMTSENATILIESDYGSDDNIVITLENPKYNGCDIYNEPDRWEIRCSK